MTLSRSSYSIHRRGFLQSASATLIAASTWQRAKGQTASKPRIAAIVTEYRGYSHADVILGRFLQGHILSATETYWPRTHVVSMYVDQIPAGDLSRGMAAQYGATITPTIRQALTLNTDELAIDGVLIIGEHGDYPYNDKGQHLYPRRRFFQEVVDTFTATGSTAPVFNDKHLGFAWQDAKWMYDQSRRLQFPLMAGSSLPTTWRKPDVDLPLNVDLREALAIGYGGIEAYGFHALETLQCMTERRRGGETGVKAVTCLEGPEVWRAALDGRWSSELLDAARWAVSTVVRRNLPKRSARDRPHFSLSTLTDSVQRSSCSMATLRHLASRQNCRAILNSSRLNSGFKSQSSVTSHI